MTKTLSITNGDFALDGSRNFQIVDNLTSLQQRVEQRLRTLKGEWFLDRNLGIPYLSNIVGWHSNPARVTRIFDAELLRFPEILHIVQSSSTIDYNNRILKFTATVQSQYGTFDVNTEV